MFEPIKVDASAPAVEDDRFPAFTVTTAGVDKHYTIPKMISGATALRALEVYVSRGELGTILWLAHHALGDEGMTAVLDSPQLTLGQAQALINSIGQHYLGAVKEVGKAQA